MDKEKRAHPRSKPAQEFTLFCISNDPDSSRGRGFNLGDRLIDLSKKGACITTVGRLRIGLPVTFEIVLPGDRSRFRAEAVVRWSETVESKGRIRQTAHVTGLEIQRVLDARGEKLGPLMAWVDHNVSGSTPESRRRARRFKPLNVTATCTPAAGLLQRLTFGSTLSPKIRDLSLGGAQIVTSKKLEVGQKIVVKLAFAHPKRTVVADGEVLWSRRDTMILEPTWYSGVAFRNVTPDDREGLKMLEKFFG